MYIWPDPRINAHTDHRKAAGIKNIAKRYRSWKTIPSKHRKTIPGPEERYPPIPAGAQ